MRRTLSLAISALLAGCAGESVEHAAKPQAGEEAYAVYYNKRPLPATISGKLEGCVKDHIGKTGLDKQFDQITGMEAYTYEHNGCHANLYFSEGRLGFFQATDGTEAQCATMLESCTGYRP
jgi:hypothetical protein